MLKVSGSNDFNQLGEESNCIGFVFKTPAICPPKESHLEVSSISSFSCCENQTVVVTNNGEILVVGDNSKGKIAGSGLEEIFTKFTKFEIKDEDGHNMYPISAACGSTFTLYLVSSSKNSDKTRLVVYYIGKKKSSPLFLDIGDSKPVSIFCGNQNAASINSDDSIIFMPIHSFRSQLKPSYLPDNEKPVSIACCISDIYVTALSGRVFKSYIPGKGNVLKFSLVESLKNEKISEVNGIYHFCFAVTKDGHVFASGNNDYGNFGIPEASTSEFVKVSSLNEYKIIHAYAGYCHSLFQTAEGKILACGSNLFGELLTSNQSRESIRSPIETEITQGATFCVTGSATSAVFIGHDPSKSPNHPITTKKVQSAQPQDSTSPEEVNQLKEKISKLENILLLTSQRPNNNSKSGDNYFIDSDLETEFYTKPVKIGEGGTSITYKVTDTRTLIPICKKVVKYRNGQSNIKDAKNALKEFEVLLSINHPCICKAVGINLQEPINITNDDGEEEETTTIALFLEYVDYSLADILKKKINNTSKVRIVLDICHAMNFLHKHNMMHRDLKIENIMLNSFFETKLVDFGLVRINESVINDYSFVEDSKTRGIGTFAYMSPEMANEEDYTYKTDVYSFGVVLHFIFTGNLPNQKLSEKVTGKKIQLPSPSKSISKFCIELIEKCMSYEQSKRPSFEEILVLLRENSYQLAPDVDPSILSRRDQELELIENYK